MPKGFDQYGRVVKDEIPDNDGIATFTSTPDGIAIDFPIPADGYDSFGQYVTVSGEQACKESDAEYCAILEAELRTQLQQAWQRLDYKTADRIADLLGEPRPTEHEGLDRANAKEA
jgi:hypothetical protein